MYIVFIEVKIIMTLIFPKPESGVWAQYFKSLIVHIFKSHKTELKKFFLFYLRSKNGS